MTECEFVTRYEFNELSARVESLSAALGEILSIFLRGKEEDGHGITHGDARRTLERLKSHYALERSRPCNDEKCERHTDAPGPEASQDSTPENHY
jgi:hypothetical protein